MSDYINDGNATTMWNGISHNYLLKRCADATPDEAATMSTAASLMAAGECTHAEWNSARAALAAVEQRLCEVWEHEHGEPRRNKAGRIIGGEHPALRPDLYDEALRNVARNGGAA